MKRIILLSSVLLLFVHILSAQIVTGEQPTGLTVSRNANIVYGDTAVQVLSAPDRAILNREDSIADSQPGPLRFARAIHVNYTLYNSGTWQVLANGDKLWTLKVKLPGALSSNAVYDKFWLPEGTKFFVYSEETEQYIGAVTSEYIGGSYEEPVPFATGLIYGESVVFEYYQPVSVEDSAIISIPFIYYGYRYVNNPYTAQTQGIGESGSCQVNINCSEGNNWQAEKRAVARIIVPTTAEAGLCSCALINNTSNDNTPYVLTADHCLVGNFPQWVFYWDYEYSGCSNSGTPTNKTTTGATIVANNSASDFALLQLTQDPRSLTNFTPYYLGWDRSGNAGTGGVGIHHPSGDVKKISTHNITPYNSNCFSGTNSNFWKLNWIATTNGHSVTEGGSSGSPLFNNNHRVIGQLYGAGPNCSNTNCSNPSADIANYGKFSVSWTGGGTNTTRLSNWLDPAGTNPTTLNGISFVRPTISGPSSVCSGNATFTVSNPPSGYTWGYSSSLTLVSTSDNSATFSKTGSGGESVYVSITVGGVTVATNYFFMGGTPDMNSIPINVGCEGAYRFGHIPLSLRYNVDEFEWQGTNSSITIEPYPSGYIDIPGDRVRITGYNGGVEVRARNACGWGAWKTGSYISAPCN
jgi:V8-like Glu-specific endopeptidase/predicted secreted protein